MKVIALILKIFATVSILMAVMAFGSDLLPVDGFSFGGQESGGGGHHFYKIVPSDGVNHFPIGVTFLVVGIILFVVSTLIKKHLENKSRGT